MAYSERDKTPTLSSTDSITISIEEDEPSILSSTDSRSDARLDSNYSRFTYRRRSASPDIPVNSVHSSKVNFADDSQSPAIQMSGSLGQNESNSHSIEIYPSLNSHLLKSGQLGMCNDPYCTTCPSYFHYGQRKISKSSDILEHKFRNMISGEAKCWAKRITSFLCPFIPPVMNPHAKIIQQWNQFFVISCLCSIFIDPLFFFLLTVHKEKKCIVLNQTLKTTLVVLRSCTDFVYLLNLLLQFRLAYVAPESRVVGAGDLVDDPKKIALHYLSGGFWINLFLVAPVPQTIILLILPHDNISASNLLRAAILVQYIPRFYRFFPFLVGRIQGGFIFESAWSKFVINILIIIMTSHMVGSIWYLFGIQRVNKCLRDACRESGIPKCIAFLDCGDGSGYSKFESNPNWDHWTNNSEACFDSTGGSFDYGIYVRAVELTTVDSVVVRYIYSLFWGFQQISTLAGNQVPSYYVWEVLFTIFITGSGLVLFALLIGNMQNIVQSLSRRQLESTLRHHDVEQWMSHRRLPIHLRKKVQQEERYKWAATKGVNEEMLLQNLSEDLQQEIRRHLFEFIKKVRIFAVLDGPILDYIRERLRQTTYIKDNNIFYPGGFVDKMVFIVRGKAESIGEGGIVVPLSENDVCGEELLTWCLEHTSVDRDLRNIRIAGHRLVSNRLVRCLTNVDAFVLRFADIEQVTSLFARFLRSSRVQGAIRYESPYWRSLAARRIQVAWRYRRMRLNRAD